jgi:hypothetical protein
MNFSFGGQLGAHFRMLASKRSEDRNRNESICMLNADLTWKLELVAVVIT